MQQALRVGKRAHAETGIDRAGQSVVTAALDLAAAHLDGDLTGRPAWWSARARWARWRVATLVPPRRRPADRHQPGRRPGRPARRGVRRHGRADRRLAAALATVDIVVAATASTEPVLTREMVARALADARAPAAARWSCSTSRCPGTSSPTSPSCPASW